MKSIKYSAKVKVNQIKGPRFSLFFFFRLAEQNVTCAFVCTKCNKIVQERDYLARSLFPLNNLSSNLINCLAMCDLIYIYI